MSERQWNTHEPYEEAHTCKECGERFYANSNRIVYCETHRTKSHGTPKESTCANCGATFTQNVRKDSRGRRRYCDTCRVVMQEANLAKARAVKAKRDIAKDLHTKSGRIRLAESNLDMVARPISSDDNPWELVEEKTLRETREILHDLETHEVLYGASLTEHHQERIEFIRLDLAIDKVNPKKVEEMIAAMTRRERSPVAEADRLIIRYRAVRSDKGVPRGPRNKLRPTNDYQKGEEP